MRARVAAMAVIWMTGCLWACSAGPGGGTGISPRRETAVPAAVTNAESAESAESAEPAEPAAPAAPVLPATPAVLDEAPCPPVEPQPHCVLLTLRPGAEARAAAFIARAARDQIEVHREGSLLVTYLTDAQISQHFGGRVVYQRVAASASNTGHAGACNAYLEDTVIPAKYARDLASIAIGHQICE